MQTFHVGHKFEAWKFDRGSRSGPWVSHTRGIYPPSSVQGTLGSTNPFSQIRKMPQGVGATSFFYAFFYRNTVDRLQTDGLPKPTEASSQHQHRWGQGWEGQPVSRSGFTFEESPEIAFSWVHDLSFFPSQIRNSPEMQYIAVFVLIEIMSPKPLVASNSFMYESRRFPSGDYQHLKERSSNPGDQGKTVEHQLCLVSGARNSKLLFLPPGPGRLLAS